MVAKDVVDVLLQLSRVLLAENDGDRLTSAQWIALRYFSRANSYSRTLSGLAQYQATTPGTVSQTIKSLENAGYLERDISLRDARSSVFTVTDAGRAVMEEDPLAHLSQEVEHLSGAELVQFRNILRFLIANVGLDRPSHPFGTCRDCAFLLARRGRSVGADADVTYLCKFLKFSLLAADLDNLCRNFQAVTSQQRPETL
ncbi:MAG: MarR family transcriptional regulator [Hyphomicrobium sp.]|uniref:MarR family winged helix-turn-helix transcriptional regulator n=1 Tax=Hyphomicrobium sp. TaxID=82 RepID=UPI0039E32CCA